MDIISNFITTVRNASLSKKKGIVVASSRSKREIARILKGKNFISNFSEKKNKKGLLSLTLKLAYKNGNPMISRIRRISKPGQRIYKKYPEIPTIFPKTYIISTSKGFMTGKRAKKEKIGGEIILEIM